MRQDRIALLIESCPQIGQSVRFPLLPTENPTKLKIRKQNRWGGGNNERHLLEGCAENSPSVMAQVFFKNDLLLQLEENFKRSNGTHSNQRAMKE